MTSSDLSFLGSAFGRDFYRVAWIMAAPAGGDLAELRHYCPASGWATTPAAQLIDHAAELALLAEERNQLLERAEAQAQLIAQQDALIAQLRGELATVQTAPPTPDLPAVDTPPPAPAEAEDGREACPDCGYRVRHGYLAKHQGSTKCHELRLVGHAAPLPPTPRTARLVQPDARFWCGRCNNDAFAESVRTPGVCMRCAGEYANANGHHAVATETTTPPHH